MASRKEIVIVSIYFFYFFLCLFILAYAVIWKRFGPGCYFVISYRTAMAGSVSQCQRICAKDRKCVQGHYLRPVCSLVSSTDYDVMGCSRKSYLVRKGKEFCVFHTHNPPNYYCSSNTFFICAVRVKITTTSPPTTKRTTTMATTTTPSTPAITGRACVSIVGCFTA